MNFFKLITSIILCLFAGFMGSIFTVTSMDSWYSTLNQPFFNPPNWLFGPVWTILYLLMGISFYIIWSKGVKTIFEKKAVIIFTIQLLLNTLWSILFFGLKSPFLALIEIIFLWTAIFISMSYFFKISRAAAYLLIPYILWVSFAAILNLGYVLLN